MDTIAERVGHFTHTFPADEIMQYKGLTLYGSDIDALLIERRNDKTIIAHFRQHHPKAFDDAIQSAGR